MANTALAALKYTPTENYDLDTTATVVVTDADGESTSDSITLDLSPTNESPLYPIWIKRCHLQKMIVLQTSQIS